ncbi:tetratricopeptide repeat protein [Nitrososphaera sp.]|uniref:tetratricopeptide repeat protein n=1 Tax=Nitrososphaera sp. TaxID=1971748 RepID=UPI002EDAD8CD
MMTEQKGTLIEAETIELNAVSRNHTPMSRYELLQELQRFGINTQSFESLSKEALEQFLLGIRSAAATHSNVVGKPAYHDPEIYALVDGLSEKAIHLQDRGQYEESLTLLKAAAKLAPRASIWYDMAIALERFNHLPDALDCLDKAIGADPNHLEAWIRKAVILRKLRRYDEAFECKKHTAEMETYTSGYWNNQGIAFGCQGKNERALRCFERASEINQNDYSVWYNRGTCLGTLGFYENALECFERAIEIRPLEAVAWYNKGIVLKKLVMVEEALAAFQRATEIDPSYSDAWYNRGITLRLLGNERECKSCLARAKKSIHALPA